MTVELRDSRRFDASAHSLVELYLDPVFQEERSRHLGVRSVRCERFEDGEELVLVLHEERDTGWDGHLFESRTTTRWDADRRRASWVLEQTGGPGEAHAHGTLAVRSLPGGCALEFTASITVRAPLIARWIERLARRGVRGERAREAELIRERLREARRGVGGVDHE